MPRVAAALLLAILATGACGSAQPPAARGGVERGTALPPPGFNAAAETTRR